MCPERTSCWGGNPNQLLSDRIVEQARTWIGVPFLHQGRTRIGVDCLGLVIAVGQELGMVDLTELEIKMMSRYRRIPRVEEVLPALLVKTLEPGPEVRGAIVHLTWGPGRGYHAGILVEQGTVVHASSLIGSVQEEKLGEHLSILGCYQYRSHG